MNSGAILILIVSVIGADGGAFRVDAGRLAGLRVGDAGEVFYQLTVRDEVRRVEVGTAEVTAVEETSATLRMPASEQVREGYRVEFSVPAGRLDRRQAIQRTSAEVDGLRRRLEEAELRIGELERDLQSSLAARAELESSLAAARSSVSEGREGSEEQLRRLREAEEGRAAAEARAAELEERLVASQMHAGAALATLQEGLDAARERASGLQAELDSMRSEPGDATQPSPVVATQESAAPEIPTPAPPMPDAEAGTDTDPTAGVIRLEGARYEVGLPVSEASFYNQTPRFSRHVDSLWIDSTPVTRGEFARVMGAAPPNDPGDLQTAVTFEEAMEYCGSVGKRLPTEVEWEAAFTTAPLESQPAILEWTASWYQAYPGNDRVEADYGERFRVIRASSGSRRDRRYMAPADRDGSVGFRCVRPESAN